MTSSFFQVIGVPEMMSSARREGIRAFKIVIEAEKLVTGATIPATRLEDDFKSVHSLLEDDHACLVMMRVDGHADNSDNWILIAWTPDASPVREKMLFASSRSLVRQSAAQHVQDFFCSTKEEVSYEGFLALSRKCEEAPLTEKEQRDAEERNQTRDIQARAMKSLPVTWADGAEMVVERLAKGEILCTHITFASATEDSLQCKVIPGQTKVAAKSCFEEPGYVLGHIAAGIVLMMVCPNDCTSTKLLMRCASFKASVLQLCEALLPNRKIYQLEVREVTDLDELDIVGKTVDIRAGVIKHVGGKRALPKTAGRSSKLLSSVDDYF